jgi:predicted Fe-Mo cluster-binding NifX family protein
VQEKKEQMNPKEEGGQCMKIAVSTAGKTLNDRVDPRFGRAPHFAIIDSESMDFTVVDNNQSLNLAQGAGIQAAQTIINEGVSALITGNCGPKAFTTLNAAGIEVYTGAHGSLKEAVEQFKAGTLTKADGANVPGHWN